MEITLKNVKIAAFASQETTCFEATLYIDGRRAAVVANDGGGGCNRYRFADRALEARFRAHCAALPPLPADPERGYGPLPMDADLLVGQLLARHEAEKQHRRWCKDAVVFRLKGDEVGTYRSLKTAFTERIRPGLVARYGDALEEILNETIGQVPIPALGAPTPRGRA
jgi:hypothetical protein